MSPNNTTQPSVPASPYIPDSTGTGGAQLRWSAPTTYTDGTPITSLSGFRVYYSTNSREVADRTSTLVTLSPNLISISLEELAPGTWYFAVSAVDGSNVEGELSVVLSKQIVAGEEGEPGLLCENVYEYGTYRIVCE